MLSYFKYFFALCVLILFVGYCSRKEPETPNPVHRKSPIAIANILHNPTNTYVKIVYGQPYKRGRKIFGGLVPYGEVWRTGANEATELTTTKTIRFGGKKIGPGTYSLFTIPKENGPWTIILNNKLDQWGAFEYQKEFDEFRIEAPVSEKSTSTEKLTIQFDEFEGNSTNILLQWDQTEVKIPVKFIANTISDTSASSG